MILIAIVKVYHFLSSNVTKLTCDILFGKLVYVNLNQNDSPCIEAEKLAIALDTFEKTLNTGLVWLYWIKSDNSMYIEWETHHVFTKVFYNLLDLDLEEKTKRMYLTGRPI